MRLLTVFIFSLLPLAAMTLQQPAPSPPNMAASASDSELGPKLVAIKRIYVESFGDETVAKQVQAMIVTSISESKRFIITENKEKADAVLKGVGLEKTAQEFHAYSEGTAAGHAAGGHSSTISGSSVGGIGSISGSSHGGFASAAAAIQDSSASTETINDARVAVRLVDKDGDVIWATTQESKGAKYKGASADVADKVVKQLLRDVEKAEKKRVEAPPPQKPT